MWITVLGLAIAVNFEPMRLGLIALALSRPRPVLQLLAFLTGSFVMSATAGLVVLFAVRPVAVFEFDRAKVHLALGVLALGAAAVLASRIGQRRAATVGGPPRERALVARARALTSGTSPWVSGVLGLTIAIPSIDYLALLVLIATSGAGPWTQTAMLFTFITVANTVVGVPLLSFLISPVATRIRLEALRRWVAARRRRDVALVLLVAGVVLVVLGITGM
jgi:hypothetical protein